MKNARRKLLLIILILTFSMPAIAETWDCPNCGETGNAGNFCGKCGNPKPEQDTSKGTVSYAVGDTVTLGTYAGEEIEWQVLADNNSGTYLLLSRYALTSKAYNDEYTSVTWENCSLRKWLNEDFLNDAFTDEEKAKLVPLTTENPANAKYGTAGGETTTDTVWLLSIGEANEYFGGNSGRVCAAAEAAASGGAWTSEDNSVIWWLRSPGHADSNAAVIGSRGRISNAGNFVDTASVCVRPVICFSPSGAIQTELKEYSAETIKQVQRKLNESGFNCGSADGKIGNKTRSAIREYRQANGLTDSEEIDSELLRAMGIADE